MSKNAALLIDLENFYLARETTAASGSDEPYDVIGDLERLCRFASRIVGEDRRLIVRRAYADFSASRLNEDAEIGRPRREYFLRSVPTVLMDQGIEPVQVFRFPGGSRGVAKNAADMRLAMDATGLIANVDFFILITGDKDFIPLVLELRQRGAYVVGMGAHGSISRILTAYCDEFHEFEQLEAEARSEAELPLDEATAPVATSPVGVAVVSQGPRPHSLPLYRRLMLTPGKLRLHIHEHSVWRIVTDQVFDAATNPDGGAAVVLHHELRSAVIDQLADEGYDNAGKTTNDTLFLIFKAGCFVCADPGPRYGMPDFNWTNHGARLAPSIDSAQALRRHAYGFALDRLVERLRDYDGRAAEPELAAAMLFGPEPSADDQAWVRAHLGEGKDATGT